MIYFLRDKEVTTRMRHRCCWCGEWIRPGERARSRAYKTSDGLLSDYMHPECNEASSVVGLEEGMDFEWLPGDFRRGSTESV